MTAFLAFPPARELRGVLRVPASKSATNRALLLAALSDTPVRVESPLESEDTRALLACLAALGARIEKQGDSLLLCGPLHGGSEERVLDAADSGTAARFLIAVCAATEGRFRLVGSPRLSERPMGELVTALRSLGADIREEGAPGCLPVVVRGSPGFIEGGAAAVDASRSSQFLSALLLAGAAAGSIEVSASGSVASLPYVTLTIEALRAFGHDVEGSGPWRVRRGERSPHSYTTPGDFSSAVPLLSGVGICGGEVSLTGLRWPSPEADALAIPVLAGMGVQIETRGNEIRARAGRGGLRSVSALATDFPDAVPALAAAAAFARGRTRFHGIAHLRWKESDRLAALSTLLARAGAAAVADEDGLSIDGGGLSAVGDFVVLPTARDHRIAMAAALLSLARPRALIENPDCVSKSYPGFFRDLEALCRR